MLANELMQKYKGEVNRSAMPSYANSEPSSVLASQLALLTRRGASDHIVDCMSLDPYTETLVYLQANPFARRYELLDWTHYQVAQTPINAATIRSKWEKALSELSGLLPNDDFISPSTDLIHDLETLAEILSDATPRTMAFPSIEHDGSTGLITLSWFEPATRATFAISLKGGKQIYAVYINPVSGEIVPFQGKQIRSHDLQFMSDDARIAAVVAAGA